MMHNIRNIAAYIANCIVAYGVGANYFEPERKVFKTNKQISELYPTLFTPAGWAFAIWGIIFGLEGISVLWMNDISSLGPCAEQGSKYWLYACFFQSGWTIAFALNKIPLAMILMLCIYASMYMCYTGFNQCSVNDQSIIWYILGVLPYCIHCAWVGGASIVSMNISAAYLHLHPSTQLQLAWSSTVAVIGLALGMSFWHKEPTFAIVGAWALHAVSAFDQPEALQRAFEPADRSRFRRFAQLAAVGLLANGLFHMCLLSWRMQK